MISFVSSQDGTERQILSGLRACTLRHGLDFILWEMGCLTGIAISISSHTVKQLRHIVAQSPEAKDFSIELAFLAPSRNALSA